MITIIEPTATNVIQFTGILFVFTHSISAILVCFSERYKNPKHTDNRGELFVLRLVGLAFFVAHHFQFVY